MSAVKIQLSQKEKDLVSDTGIILTKNRILEAVMEIFGAVSEAETEYTRERRQLLPAPLFLVPPKISRGEKYRHFPWVMLDYPRVFNADETLAIRHFFWWGHFFSVSIHVTGKYRQQLLQNWRDWPKGTYICVQASPWEHHFDKDNYLPVAELPENKLLQLAAEQDFLKLSLALPISQWDAAPAFLLDSFTKFLDLLSD